MHNIIDEKFWLAIAFLGFVALLIKYVLPMISAKLGEATKNIAKELEEARSMKEKAQKLLEESEKRFEEASKLAEKTIKESAAEAQKFLDEARKNIEIEVNKKTEALLTRIKFEEEKAVREMKVQIITMALGNIQSNLQNSDKNRANNLIKKSIDGINKIIH